MNQVEAAKTKEQRTQVEAQLLEAGRIYHDIWKLGVNTALRISDLLSLTMADVKALNAKSPVEIKTRKQRRIVNIDRRRKQPISRRAVARVFEKTGQRIAPKVQLSTQ